MGWLTRARGCLQYQRTSLGLGVACALAVTASLVACSSSKDAAPATAPTVTSDADVADAAPDVRADDPACNAFEPRAAAVDFVLGPTDLEKTVTAAIDAAKTRIDLAAVEIGTKPILQSLAAAKKRGVTLRARRPARRVRRHEGRARRRRPRGARRLGSPRQGDGRRRREGVHRLGRARAGRHRDGAHVLHVRERPRRRRSALRGRRARLGRHRGLAHAPVHKLVLSPVNARARLTELVDSASEKLDLELEQATDDKLVASIKARAAAGVHPRVLLADPVVVKTNTATGDMTAAGAEVRYYRKLTLASSMIVTERAAMVGSHALTTVSLDTRRDVSVLVSNDEARSAAESAFDADWAAGTPR
ncbi:MAG: phospholipase D-like domain-containing protein [Polyangiaceae bacterium]